MQCSFFYPNGSSVGSTTFRLPFLKRIFHFPPYAVFTPPDARVEARCLYKLPVPLPIS